MKAVYEIFDGFIGGLKPVRTASSMTSYHWIYNAIETVEICKPHCPDVAKPGTEAMQNAYSGAAKAHHDHGVSPSFNIASYF